MDPETLRSAWDQVLELLTLLLGRRSVQLGYLVSAVVLVAVTLIAVAWARWSWGRACVAVAAALSLALFPALTLARRGVNLRRSPTCDWAWGLEPTNAEQVLNVVLLLPAAFFAAWAVRRVWPVVLAALALSLGAEMTQAALDIGACQAGDMARNFAGALLGAVAGRLVAWFLDRGGRDRAHGQEAR